MSGSTLSGNNRRYYYCRQTRLKADDPQRCEARYVRADEIEESVMAELSKVLERPDVVLAELLDRETGGSQQLDVQIRELENELRAGEDQEKRLIRLYRFGEIDDDFILRETRAIKERKERMRHELAELKNRRDNLGRLTELAPKVGKSAPESRKPWQPSTTRTSDSSWTLSPSRSWQGKNASRYEARCLPTSPLHEHRHVHYPVRSRE
jgi:hypothetical protein